MTNTTLAVGDYITSYDQMDNLPAGSVIHQATNPDRTWEKNDDGMWQGIHDNSGPYRSVDFSMGQYNRLTSIPATPRARPPADTLRRYQWRFFENAVSGAHENGVSMDATMKGLGLMGLRVEDFPLGPEVKFKVLDDRSAWPEGTVIANSNRVNPKAESYTLFVRKRRTWTTLLGRSGLTREAVVVQYPGVESPPEWWSEAADEESEQQIAQFKARAWRIGQRIKAEQSWCGTYEHVIARVGVTARSIREAQGHGFGVGDRVGQRDAANLPVGSLLAYRSDDWSDHWAIYQRDDTAVNMTRTVRIAGHRVENAPALGHYQPSMMVAAIPVGDDPAWVVDSPNTRVVLDILPVGTVFDYSGVRYVIAGDHMMTQYRDGGPIPSNGVHNSSAFHGAQTTLIRFPEEHMS